MSAPVSPEAFVRRILRLLPLPLLRLLPGRAVRIKAIWFASIGIVNASVDFAVFALLYLQADLGVVIANSIAWLVAVTCSYVLNSTITFAAESGRVLRLRDYLTFAASQVAGLIANTATVLVASFFVPVLVGKVIAIGVSFLVNFSLSHFVVFPAHRAPGPREGDVARETQEQRPR